MRPVSLVLIIFVSVTAGQVPAGVNAARFEGRIFATTGEPLDKAKVYLENSAMSYIDTSDADGTFRFERVAPGSYNLRADRPGYLSQWIPTPFEIALGQVVKHIRFEMPKAGIISGRVIDQDGDPVAGVEVRTLNWGYIEGQKRVSSGASSTTDDRGNFRMANFSPGRYFLEAVIGQPERREGVLGRQRPRESLISTYYPSELDPARATPIEISVGSNISVEIRVRKERTFAIRGKVAGAGARSSVLVITGTESGDSTQTQIDARDGSFETPYLPSGTYLLHTSPRGMSMNIEDEAPRVDGRLQVTINNSDVDGVVLDLHPTIQLKGVVLMESDDSHGPPAAAVPAESGLLTIIIREVDPVLLSGGGLTMKQDGTFQFKALTPSRYALEIRNVSTTGYVKSIRFDDQDAIHALLDLTSGTGGTLEILLGRHPAEVVGTVRNGEQDMQVALWPATPERGRLRSEMSVYSGKNGEFRFSGLAPGEYYLAAWPEVEPAMLYNPEFRTAIQLDASKVSLKEGLRATVDLTVIPKDRVAAELAKLR